MHKALMSIFFLLILTICGGVASAKETHHYVFFERERERINEPSFIKTRAFEGAQIKYTWKELEPAEDRYDFGIIREDLASLAANEKKLFIQLQDVTFDASRIYVPQYLLDDSSYNGGVALQYNDKGEPEGQVARRWDPLVRERFHKLLSALGREFNGKIEGIALPETAVGIEEGTKKSPAGFTYKAYRDGILENMKALKESFPKSVTIQYANFMPGEWLPDDDHSYLRSVYQYAVESKIGVGGPDLLPHKRGQMNHSYALIRKTGGVIPVGIAVQWDNYAHINPKTGKRLTIQELIEFAKDYLGADYIFWCTQEPYYSKELIPYLSK